MADKSPSDVDLLELVGIAWAHRIFILILAVLGAAAAALLAFTMKPKFDSVATFLVRQDQSSSPLDNWGALAEQFGYKIKTSSDPLLNMVDRVLKSDSFYAPFLGRSLSPDSPDSSLAHLLKIDSVPEDERLDVFAARMSKLFKLKLGEDKVYTLTVSTEYPHLSQFVANGIIDGLNDFFRERQAKDHQRKLTFLLTELDKTRREMDSASNSVRLFLESNKDFSSPLLSYRYQRLKRDETVYNEKFMITMKAYQSLNITASQPEYFFEEFERGKLPKKPSHPNKPKLIAAGFGASLLMAIVLVVVFRWLVRVRRTRAA